MLMIVIWVKFGKNFGNLIENFKRFWQTYYKNLEKFNEKLNILLSISFFQLKNLCSGGTFFWFSLGAAAVYSYVTPEISGGKMYDKIMVLN